MLTSYRTFIFRNNSVYLFRNFRNGNSDIWIFNIYQRNNMEVSISHMSSDRKDKFRMFFQYISYLRNNFCDMIWLNNKIIDKWCCMFVSNLFAKQIEAFSSDQPIFQFLIIN